MECASQRASGNDEPRRGPVALPIIMRVRSSIPPNTLGRPPRDPRPKLQLLQADSESEWAAAIRAALAEPEGGFPDEAQNRPGFGRDAVVTLSVEMSSQNSAGTKPTTS